MSDFLYPVPAQPPADGTQHTCTFGDDWLAIILDRIDDLQSGEWFDTPPADIKQQIRELLDLLEIDATPPPRLFTEYQFWHSGVRRVITGAALTYTAITGEWMGFHTIQTPAVINDETEIRFTGKAGIYTFGQLGTKNNNRGGVTLYIDGVDFAFYDYYNASQVLNVIDITAFEALTDGEHVLRFKVNFKNASSSGYVYAPIAFWLSPQF